MSTVATIQAQAAHYATVRHPHLPPAAHIPSALARLASHSSPHVHTAFLNAIHTVSVGRRDSTSFDRLHTFILAILTHTSTSPVQWPVSRRVALTTALHRALVRRPRAAVSLSKVSALTSGHPPAVALTIALLLTLSPSVHTPRLHAALRAAVPCAALAHSLALSAPRLAALCPRPALIALQNSILNTTRRHYHSTSTISEAAAIVPVKDNDDSISAASALGVLLHASNTTHDVIPLARNMHIGPRTLAMLAVAVRPSAFVAVVLLDETIRHGFIPATVVAILLTSISSSPRAVASLMAGALAEDMTKAENTLRFQALATCVGSALNARGVARRKKKDRNGSEYRFNHNMFYQEDDHDRDDNDHDRDDNDHDHDHDDNIDQLAPHTDQIETIALAFARAVVRMGARAAHAVGGLLSGGNEWWLRAARDVAADGLGDLVRTAADGTGMQAARAIAPAFDGLAETDSVIVLKRGIAATAKAGYDRDNEDNGRGARIATLLLLRVAARCDVNDVDIVLEGVGQIVHATAAERRRALVDVAGFAVLAGEPGRRAQGVAWLIEEFGKSDILRERRARL